MGLFIAIWPYVILEVKENLWKWSEKQKREGKELKDRKKKEQIIEEKLSVIEKIKYRKEKRDIGGELRNKEEKKK